MVRWFGGRVFYPAATAQVVGVGAAARGTLMVEPVAVHTRVQKMSTMGWMACRKMSLALLMMYPLVIRTESVLAYLASGGPRCRRTGSSTLLEPTAARDNPYVAANPSDVTQP